MIAAARSCSSSDSLGESPTVGSPRASRTESLRTGSMLNSEPPIDPITPPKIQNAHHQCTSELTGSEVQESLPFAFGSPPRQTSLAICFGRQRLKMGMNQAPTDQPLPQRSGRPVIPATFL